jgi:hypothetical protein
MTSYADLFKVLGRVEDVAVRGHRPDVIDEHLGASRTPRRGGRRFSSLTESPLRHRSAGTGGPDPRRASRPRRLAAVYSEQASRTASAGDLSDSTWPAPRQLVVTEPGRRAIALTEAPLPRPAQASLAGALDRWRMAVECAAELTRAPTARLLLIAEGFCHHGLRRRSAGARPARVVWCVVLVKGQTTPRITRDIGRNPVS